jgi:bis(5'-nucleosidyl)-tetraphosphatase
LPIFFSPVKTLSAGVIPISKTSKVLILRAYKYWDFPKGHVEDGETPFVAALRELKEETGIEEISFPWGNSFIETAPYAGGKIARYYLGRVNQDQVILSHEHHEWRWIEPEEAQSLFTPRVCIVLKWGVKLMGGLPAQRMV